VTDTSNLPESARILVEHLGATVALKIIKVWPGLKFRVPLGIRDESPMRQKLVELLGEDDTLLVMEQFGGEIIYVATCAQAVRDVRDTQIIAEYSAGGTIVDLALRYRLTSRQIETILQRTPGANTVIRHRVRPVDENQFDLFGHGVTPTPPA